MVIMINRSTENRICDDCNLNTRWQRRITGVYKEPAWFDQVHLLEYAQRAPLEHVSVIIFSKKKKIIENEK